MRTGGVRDDDLRLPQRVVHAVDLLAGHHGLGRDRSVEQLLLVLPDELLGEFRRVLDEDPGPGEIRAQAVRQGGLAGRGPSEKVDDERFGARRFRESESFRFVGSKGV